MEKFLRFLEYRKILLEIQQKALLNSKEILDWNNAAYFCKFLIRSIDYYPELWDYKPPYEDIWFRNAGFWFPPLDAESRIKILQDILNNWRPWYVKLLKIW